jgi:hypothetical protein
LLTAQGLFDLGLGAGIEAGGGLVEDGGGVVGERYAG